MRIHFIIFCRFWCDVCHRSKIPRFVYINCSRISGCTASSWASQTLVFGHPNGIKAFNKLQRNHLCWYRRRHIDRKCANWTTRRRSNQTASVWTNCVVKYWFYSIIHRPKSWHSFINSHSPSAHICWVFIGWKHWGKCILCQWQLVQDKFQHFLFSSAEWRMPTNQAWNRFWAICVTSPCKRINRACGPASNGKEPWSCRLHHELNWTKSIFITALPIKCSINSVPSCWRTNAYAKPYWNHKRCCCSSISITSTKPFKSSPISTCRNWSINFHICCGTAKWCGACWTYCNCWHSRWHSIPTRRRQRYGCHRHRTHYSWWTVCRLVR